MNWGQQVDVQNCPINCYGCGTSLTPSDGSVTIQRGGPDAGNCKSEKHTQFIICNNCGCNFSYTIKYVYYRHLWEDSNNDGVYYHCVFECGYPYPW